MPIHAAFAHWHVAQKNDIHLSFSAALHDGSIRTLYNNRVLFFREHLSSDH